MIHYVRDANAGMLIARSVQDLYSALLEQGDHFAIS